MSNGKPDGKYLELYRGYAQALRAYESATKDRRRVRTHLAARRAAPAAERRPVGSPRGSTIPEARPARAQQPPGQREHQIYLGKVLGWAKIIPCSAPTPSGPDPAASFDVNKVYDKISLRQYLNAKEDYQQARKAFFDYARQLTNEMRRQQKEEHRERATGELQHAADLQWLGVDPLSESDLDRARAEVEGICKHAWAIYQRSPSPKSDAAVIQLLEAFQEAQLVGLDDSNTVKTIDGEVTRLLNSSQVPFLRR
jgi:hypothetical protein